MRYRWIVTVLLLAGCGGGGGGNEGAAPPPVARFAFVANGGDGTVSMFAVNAATGQLRHNGYVVVGGVPAAVAVDPAGAFLYVGNQDGNLYAFSINAANGKLTAVGSPVTASGTPVAVRVDPTGRYVYVANANGNVAMYSITPGTGVPAPLGPATIGAGTSPSGIAVDPLGRFAYVSNFGSGNVSIYKISAGVLIGAGTAGAGTNPSGVDIDPSGQFVYVTNSGGGVSGYRIDGGTGALTPITVTPFPAGTAPRSIAVEPKGKYAYVANQAASGTVSAFSIDASSGVLNALVGGGVFAAGNNPITVIADPSGGFLYAANANSTDISAFQINPSGSLTPLGTVPGRLSPNSIAVTEGTSPVTYTPRFAYAANLGSNNISAFRIDGGSGALVKTGDFPGTDPFAVTVDPSGKFAYVGNEQVDINNKSVVSAFSIDSGSGALTAVPGSPYTAGTNANSVTVDPSGRFVYVGNVNSSDLSAYSIDAVSGALTPITLTPSPFTTGGTQPFSVAVEPAGKFLYVANQASGDVSAFVINKSTGALTAVGAPLATGGSLPFSIAVDPYGKFVYVANRGSGDVSAFAINSSTGVLTSLGAPMSSGPGPGGVGSAGPRSIAVDAAGRFVYTANENTSTVGALKINSDGTLGPVQGAPFKAGGGPRSVVVDPSGRFVYAGNVQDGTVSGYGIDTSNGPKAGALTEMGGSPFPAGGAPFGMVTTGTIQ